MWGKDLDSFMFQLTTGEIDTASLDAGSTDVNPKPADSAHPWTFLLMWPLRVMTLAGCGQMVGCLLPYGEIRRRIFRNCVLKPPKSRWRRRSWPLACVKR